MREKLKPIIFFGLILGFEREKYRDKREAVGRRDGGVRYVVWNDFHYIYIKRYFGFFTIFEIFI
jgi:hypothetical protein